MSTSSYHINKQRPDLQDDQETTNTVKNLEIDAYRYLNWGKALSDEEIEKAITAHQCKQCQNTFINEKGYCFAHWCARTSKIGALYNKGGQDE